MEFESLNLIIKPTNNCNMRCVYCYHAEKGYSNFKMSIDAFEEICSKTFPFVKRIYILWHGGEPMLMGLDFFKNTMAVINKYQKIYDNSVKISIQTNGTLITKEWICFFKENKIRVGSSFDGIQNETTRGNTERILENFELLKKEKMKFGIIQVLSNQTIHAIIENYELYKRLSIPVKFNFIFENQTTDNKEMLLTADQYIEKMKQFFDYWFFDTSGNIGVDPFDEYVKLYFEEFRTCRHGSCLLKWLSVDCYGNITPCGRNYPDDYSMGNISEYDDLTKAFQSKGYIKILKETIDRRNSCIETCDMYYYCKGGCSNDKLLENGTNRFSCSVFKGLFGYVKKLLDEIKNAENYNFEQINPKVKNYIKTKFLRNV